MSESLPPVDPGDQGRVRTLWERQQVRYLLAGGYNTAFGYLCFAALVLLFERQLHYTVLLLISHVVSTLNAFVAYRYFVFRVRGRFWRDLFRFWSVYAGAIAVNLVALPFVVEVLGVPVLPAQLLVVAVTTVGTFAAHKYFSFRRPAGVGEAAPDHTTFTRR